eukprot:Ihof_evm1s384 gene=Ihof_evmTU1s384
MCKSVSNHPYLSAIQEIEVNQKKFTYFSLKHLNDPRVDTLPFCIRILLESVVRNCGDNEITEEMVERVLGWNAENVKETKVTFRPARVIFQDFTGLPAIADFAALRQAIKRMGGDPTKVLPACPVDLVVDRSIHTDFSGEPEAIRKNQEAEFERNKERFSFLKWGGEAFKNILVERFSFLKWGGEAFKNILVVPPGAGICHQVNLEHLSRVVIEEDGTLYPDSLVGTDSHTTMVNSLGIVVWGVGGIEAEAVLLGQGVSITLPEVVGYELCGRVGPWVTSTDVVLTITKHLREVGVEGKYVEFYGEGVGYLSIAERATIASMCPEYGALMGFFPMDNMGLLYLRQTGRDVALIAVIEAYLKAQALFRDTNAEKGLIVYSKHAKLDLSTVVPSVSGPKRPQDRIPVKELKQEFEQILTNCIGFKGYGLAPKQLDARATLHYEGKKYTLTHGSVVIAAITGCTNTSNPSVMLGAGLLAVKAVSLGLEVKPYIRTSLSPGSLVAGCYLKESNTIAALEKLGFMISGYGCMACAGDSKPLDEAVGKAIEEAQLVACGVLSGNRNWDGRVHSSTRASFLASPLLVIACALAGTVNIDFESDPIGTGKDGQAVYLRDIWPSREELQEVERRSVLQCMYKDVYRNIQSGNKYWNSIDISSDDVYPWDKGSAYIQCPPFLDSVTSQVPSTVVRGARILLWLGDKVTTDLISPAGSISRTSPAARYLTELGVAPKDLNSYGARRGNHHVMGRGMFSNPKLENKISPKKGPFTIHWPSGKVGSVYDVATAYKATQTPLVIIGGKDYGMGASRDWAAKGPWLLGVQAVIAESFDPDHRGSLVGMGIWPLEFLSGQSAASLGLTGNEELDMALPPDPVKHMDMLVK